MGKRLDLSALASAAGSVRARPPSAAQDNMPPAVEEAGRSARSAAPSRVGRKPITGFFPGEVRKQLKNLANDEDRSMESMLAEALNDLFAKYGKPEIATTDRDRAAEGER